MDALTELYTHTPDIIQFAGIALLVVGCIRVIVPTLPAGRPVKSWQVQEESYGLPDAAYTFCVYRRFGKYRVQVQACPAYTAVIQPGLVTKRGTLELEQGFTSLAQAEEAAAEWASHNQRRLVEGVWT